MKWNHHVTFVTPVVTPCYSCYFCCVGTFDLFSAKPIFYGRVPVTFLSSSLVSIQGATILAKRKGGTNIWEVPGQGHFILFWLHLLFGAEAAYTRPHQRSMRNIKKDRLRWKMETKTRIAAALILLKCWITLLEPSASRTSCYMRFISRPPVA